MADDTKNFKVTTWEKSILLRKRKGWSIAEMVAFLNARHVTPKAVSEKAYKGWENGTDKSSQEIEERIDDVITIELYRTQSPSK